MKHAVAVLLLSLVGGTLFAAPAFKTVPMKDAATLMKDSQGYVLVDVRTPGEFAERHIPGAINIPNETIGTKPPRQLPDKNQMILVYCRSGNRSLQASRKLANMGYTNIVEIGGINAWTGPTVSGK